MLSGQIILNQWRIWGRPHGQKYSGFYAVFLENFAKSFVGATLVEGWPPSFYGESWIRLCLPDKHWVDCVNFFQMIPSFPLENVIVQIWKKLHSNCIVMKISIFSGRSRIFQTDRQPLSLVQNLFGKFFAENCMKMKEIGRKGGRPCLAPLDPPMTSQVCKYNLLKIIDKKCKMD